MDTYAEASKICQSPFCPYGALQLRPSGWVTAQKTCGFFFNFLDLRHTLKTPKMQITLLFFMYETLVRKSPIINTAQKPFWDWMFLCSWAVQRKHCYPSLRWQVGSAGCRYNMKWIPKPSWSAGDSLGCYQMLRVGFVCIPYKCKMIYLDFQKCADNFVTHLIECSLFFFSFFLLISFWENTRITSHLKYTLSGLIYIFLARLIFYKSNTFCHNALSKYVSL